MPNSIDFQVGSKFMELAGGVEVNNLQEAIKKALQEITLPDLPSSSPNASSSSSDLPRLAPPTAGGLSLETLAQMISNETRTQATKDGVASIDAKGKERAEINEKKLEEIMDRLDSMKSKGILDVFKKIFSWVGVIVGAIASVATIVAGAATGNPLLIAGGAVMLTMSINSAVSMATDGKVSISAGIAAGLKACGVPEDIAGYVGMACELAIDHHRGHRADYGRLLRLRRHDLSADLVESGRHCAQVVEHRQQRRADGQWGDEHRRFRVRLQDFHQLCGYQGAGSHSGTHPAGAGYGA